MTTINIDIDKMTLSHELKTSLSGILNTMELLKTTHLSQEQKELIDIASKAGNRLLKIGNDIVGGVTKDDPSKRSLFFSKRFVA